MSFIDKLKQRTKEAAEAAADKFFAPEEIKVIRIQTCNECPELFKPTRSCKKCGCFVDAKTKLLNQKCPIGKW